MRCAACPAALAAAAARPSSGRSWTRRCLRDAASVTPCGAVGRHDGGHQGCPIGCAGCGDWESHRQGHRQVYFPGKSIVRTPPYYPRKSFRYFLVDKSFQGKLWEEEGCLAYEKYRASSLFGISNVDLDVATCQWFPMFWWWQIWLSLSLSLSLSLKK